MRLKSLFAALVLALLVSSLALAQKTPGNIQLGKAPQPALKVEHGKTDSIWVEFKQTGSKLVVDLYVSNDEPVAGGQIPLKFGNGKTPLVADSVVFDKKRAGKFDVTNGGIDSVAQTLRLGFIADISGRKPPLETGKGRLLSVYFSLKTGKAVEVEMDSTTLAGGYSLLFADEAAQDIPVVFKKAKFKIK